MVMDPEFRMDVSSSTELSGISNNLQNSPSITLGRYFSCAKSDRGMCVTRKESPNFGQVRHRVMGFPFYYYKSTQGFGVEPASQIIFSQDKNRNVPLKVGDVVKVTYQSINSNIYAPFCVDRTFDNYPASLPAPNTLSAEETTQWNNYYAYRVGSEFQNVYRTMLMQFCDPREGKSLQLPQFWGPLIKNDDSYIPEQTIRLYKYDGSEVPASISNDQGEIFSAMHVEVLEADGYEARVLWENKVTESEVNAEITDEFTGEGNVHFFNIRSIKSKLSVVDAFSQHCALKTNASLSCEDACLNNATCAWFTDAVDSQCRLCSTFPPPLYTDGIDLNVKIRKSDLKLPKNYSLVYNINRGYFIMDEFQEAYPQCVGPPFFASRRAC